MYHIFQEEGYDWFCYVNGSTVSFWEEDIKSLLGKIETYTNPSFLHLSVEKIKDKLAPQPVTYLCSVEKLSDLIELYPELFI